MNFFQFLKSKVFFTHLAVAIVLIVAIVMGTLYSLKVYTHHGQEITVPDFTGLNLTEVAELTRKKKIRYEVIDSIYSIKQPRGTVLEQNPPANFKVKKNRRIFLTFNAFNREKTTMPNLVDKSLIQAKADLEVRGLKVGSLSYIEYNYKNLVVKQKFNGKKIKENTQLLKGSQIDLVVGKGNSDESTTSTPKLSGLTKERSAQKLFEAFLNIGEIKYDETVKTKSDTLKAVVWKQDPPYFRDNEISLGTNINLWFTASKVKAVSKQFEKKEGKE